MKVYVDNCERIGYRSQQIQDYNFVHDGEIIKSKSKGHLYHTLKYTVASISISTATVTITKPARVVISTSTSTLFETFTQMETQTTYVGVSDQPECMAICNVCCDGKRKEQDNTPIGGEDGEKTHSEPDLILNISCKELMGFFKKFGTTPKKALRTIDWAIQRIFGGLVGMEGEIVEEKN